MTTSLLKQGLEFYRWSQRHPIGKIPDDVAKEGAGENRIPFTHFGNSAPVYLVFKDIMSTSPMKTASVLDLGCGTGRNISYVKDSLKRVGFQFFGIDYSLGCIAYARKQYGKFGVTYIQHEGKIIPFPDESFDFIVSSHVLEHIPKKEDVLYISEISRILKKDGVAVIGTPNRAYCQDLFCKNPKEELKYRLVMPHLHEYYYDEFKKLIGNKKMFKQSKILQTTNLFCRQLMTQGASKVRPGEDIYHKVVFEIYSILRKNSTIQDIMAKIGSEILIKKMNITYADIIKSTFVSSQYINQGDNFIAVLKK